MDRFFKDTPKPFLEHFSELRVRLLRVLLVVTVLVCIFMSFPSIKNSIAVMLFQSLQNRFLPQGIKLIFIDSLEPIFVVTKLSLAASIFCASPYILYEFIGFMGPALLENELKSTLGIILSSTLLLVFGASLSYFFLIPATFKILISYGVIIGGIAQITFERFFSMLVAMFFVFALPFEIPVVILFLAKVGVVSSHWLKEKRKYMYVSFFIFGAVVTPDPTPFSQTLLSISMIILYEIGYVICLSIEKKKQRLHK